MTIVPKLYSLKLCKNLFTIKEVDFTQRIYIMTIKMFAGLSTKITERVDFLIRLSRSGYPAQAFRYT